MTHWYDQLVNSTVCPKCDREAKYPLCKCDHTFDPTWNLPVKHEPSQDDKLDKILALLEEIKERL